MFSFKEAFSKLDTLCKLVIPGKIHEVEVSAPVGVAHTAGGETVQDPVAHADQDLYRQKGNGHGLAK
jgi:predicted signal transduction protein with EAL and GGDEF domain